MSVCRRIRTFGLAAVAAPLVLGEVKAMQRPAILVVKSIAPPVPPTLPSITGTHQIPGMSNVGRMGEEWGGNGGGMGGEWGTA
jgi:hypothetical protein